jgi:hypothetical protein
MDDRDPPAVVCSVCGADPPPSARFCPRCGSPLEPGGVEEPAIIAGAPEPGPSPRVTFWLIPADLVLGLLLVVLGVAIALLVVGRFISGSVLLVIAVALGRLLASPATRLPDSRLGRLLATAGVGARVRSVFAATLVSSWSHAGREIVRLRRERRQLDHKRDTLIHSLGEAAYRGDREEATRYRAEAQACDAEIDTCVREERRALDEAHARIERERLTVQATRAFAANAPAGRPGSEGGGTSGGG